MQTTDPPQPDRTFHPGRRPPLPVRKHLERQAARRRVAAHARQALTAPQRANDPLIHRGRTLGAKTLKALGALAGSGAVHGAVVLLGVLVGTIGMPGREEIRQEVTVEVREREPPPPPPPPPETPPEPEPVIEKPVRPPPKVAKAPPPPTETPKAPPPVIAGLSFESTTEGGGGPSFAVGNTLRAETAERAAEPKPMAPATGETAPTADPAKTNRVASRIPSEGVKYALPRRTKEGKKDYPPTLKAQGIEADVVVTVQIDATGKVTSVKIIKESEFPEMNESARQSALDAEYQPATRDGVAIPFPLTYTIKFRLEDQ